MHNGIVDGIELYSNWMAKNVYPSHRSFGTVYEYTMHNMIFKIYFMLCIAMMMIQHSSLVVFHIHVFFSRSVTPFCCCSCLVPTSTFRIPRSIQMHWLYCKHCHFLCRSTPLNDISKECLRKKAILIQRFF